MSQFWNQLKDRVQARGAQANSTIGVIGGADGPTAVFVSTKPDSLLGTLLGLLPWGTGIISAGLLLGWCHKDKKRLLLPMILSAVGCAVGAEQAAVQAAAVWQAARHMPEIPMPGAMLRTAAANAFSTGLWFSAATLVLVSGGAVPPPRILNCILVPHRIIKAGVYPQNACGNTPAIF